MSVRRRRLLWAKLTRLVSVQPMNHRRTLDQCPSESRHRPPSPSSPHYVPHRHTHAVHWFSLARRSYLYVISVLLLPTAVHEKRVNVFLSACRLDFPQKLLDFLKLVNHCVKFATEYLGNRSVRNRWFQIGNGIWGIKRSRDRWRHVTLEGQGQPRDPNTLTAQYLENSSGDAIDNY